MAGIADFQNNGDCESTEESTMPSNRRKNRKNCKVAAGRFWTDQSQRDSIASVTNAGCPGGGG